MKKGLLFIVMLAYVFVLGFSQTNSWTVNNTGTWIEAVNGIRSEGNNKTHIITITGNISIPKSDEITFGSVTDITVTIEGKGSITPSSNGSLIRIGSKQTVIIKNIILQGRTANTSSLVVIEKSGTFRMEGTTKLSGNTITSVNGAGVHVNGGTFVM